jgi:hypothetical protein
MSRDLLLSGAVARLALAVALSGLLWLGLWVVVG